MRNDDHYLWNRSGEPDDEIQRLESLLAPLRFRPPARPRRTTAWTAIAACAVLSVAAGWMAFTSQPARARTDWAVGGRPLYAGERLTAPEGGSLAIEAEEVGRIELQPGSRLRMVESTPGRHRLQLDRGLLHAFIWAPPRQFVVDTPSARAVDLGCQYELSVSDSGAGFLRVQTGWVAFQAGRNESFIPAGAACRTSKERGPGIPYFEDAPAELRSALESYETTAAPRACERVLASARPKDGLTLWHLLQRTGAAQRPAVFDRYAALVPLPASVTRERALALDGPTLDQCWSALELDDASWWREWKRAWR